MFMIVANFMFMKVIAPLRLFPKGFALGGAGAGVTATLSLAYQADRFHSGGNHRLGSGMALSYWIERASRGLGERGRARLMAASFGLLFLVAIATGVIAILSAQADRWVAHTLEVQAQASELLSAVQDAENEHLRYILTGDPAWLKSLDVSQRDVGNAFMRLKTLTADNPTQQQRLERLKLLLDDRYSLIRQSVQMVSDGKRDDAAALVKTDQDRKLTDGIRINLTDVSMEEEQLLEQRREAAANQGQLSSAWSGSACSVSLSSPAWSACRRGATSPIFATRPRDGSVPSRCCNKSRKWTTSARWPAVTIVNEPMRLSIKALIVTANGCDSDCPAASFLAQKCAQASVAVGRDIGDAPARLQLDQSKDKRALLAQTFERNRRARLVGRDRTNGDVDVVDLPILRIDEGIGAKLADLPVRVLAVLDDESRELRVEIATNGRVGSKRNPLRIFAFVGGIDRFHEPLGGRFCRPRARSRERDPNAGCHEDLAPRNHRSLPQSSSASRFTADASIRSRPRWSWSMLSWLPAAGPEIVRPVVKLRPRMVPQCAAPTPCRSLVLIQVKPLDGYGLGSLAIGRFDVAEEFPATAYNDDAPTSRLSGGDFPWAFGQRREICGLLPRMLPRASV
jgi:CHASE3 domain sensor protein